jgi:hypothetical protein
MSGYPWVRMALRLSVPPPVNVNRDLQQLEAGSAARPDR